MHWYNYQGQVKGRNISISEDIFYECKNARLREVRNHHEIIIIDEDDLSELNDYRNNALMFKHLKLNLSQTFFLLLDSVYLNVSSRS